jgi:hypothetical protein
MFGKSKLDSAPFPRHEFADRLDALIAAAQAAGLGMNQIAEGLELRADGLRKQAALSLNLSTTPTTYDAYGVRRT